MAQRDNAASFTSALDAAAICDNKKENSFTCSYEQIVTPIKIDRTINLDGDFGFGVPENSSGGPFSGHYGPTRSELDPYFSTALGDSADWIKKVDFLMVYNDATSERGPDLNLRKTNRDAERVQTTGFRSPLMLSGFGFGLDDTPVPSVGASGSDRFIFDSEAPNNRSLWKSGPLHVMWDEERKVWTGGHQVLCGIATSNIVAPSNPCEPTSFSIKVLRNDGTRLSICDLNETLIVKNRDPSLTQDLVPGAVFVIAMRLNYEWLPLWIGCPDPDQADNTCLNCG